MLILYAGTIVLSAFLLFQVQPIIGKMVLPWFGGSAAAWTVCMLFFQLTLLLGYLYSHLTSRYLPPRRQAWLHAGLLLLAALTLPIIPGNGWKPTAGDDPALQLLGLLAATIGLPYFLLSTTGPLVQHWFAQERPGSVPYRLFALSNFASLLGLLSYPLLFEPRFTVKEMSAFWSLGFGLFALFCAALALSGRGRRQTHHTLREDAMAGKPGLHESLLWGALAAVPTVVLMAATSHLTANIAPVPLLWVLPLVIYLLTFILCFESSRWYKRWLFLPLMAILTPLLIACTSFPSLMPRGIVWPTLLFSVCIFTYCMACHGELARLKPPPAQLTAYYLVIAIGGAIGGMFTGLLAPRIFNDDYELTLSCIAAVCIAGAACHHRPAEPIQRGARIKAAVFFTTLVGVLWGANALWPFTPIVKARNFYGTVKVKDTEPGAGQARQLTHGVIVHGRQFLDPQKRRWPTTYYGSDGGAGIAIAASRHGEAQRVGVIGLGAGTMAAYCRPGDVYRFYEINPLVSEFADRQFSFLRDCPANKTVALGDARLVLDEETSQQFDLLAVDAFSGDSVPVHLLTTEAFNIYFRHLKPDGVLAIHISNRYLNMAPVVKRAADNFHRAAFLSESKSDYARGVTAATWVLVGQRDRLLPYAALHELPPAPDVRPWTDDYSSLLGIMK
ncbi:fused MFS/spermidine synthase [Pseudoduganella violaceinigra]|uniref:fused MFS/spermidine synthase n=1 Tax=Pseudoduganella violaceinigra TaxID=246602 RepID=UPI00041A16D5|nr:fused MFS/spermidine synthase [Pseudoduganella violaceinigra]